MRASELRLEIRVAHEDLVHEAREVGLLGAVDQAEQSLTGEFGHGPPCALRTADDDEARPRQPQACREGLDGESVAGAFDEHDGHGPSLPRAGVGRAA
jgi:hypothetical protein